MEIEDFERLNMLSEKALNDTASHIELVEFKLLLASWNSSVELNLFGGFYPPDKNSQKPFKF